MKQARIKRPKKGKGSGAFRELSRQLFLMVLFLSVLSSAAAVAFTMIAYEDVPGPLRGLHDDVTKWRNKIIATSQLPISRYKDVSKVDLGKNRSLEVCFAPSPKISGKLCSLIDAAKSSVDVCAYDIDLSEIVSSLASAKKRGAKVRVLTDSDNMKNSELKGLFAAKIPVKGDKRESYMHNKFVVLDNKIVWTGSWNLTKNCSYKNDNNAFFFESTALARNYTVEFNELWQDIGSANPASKRTLVPRVQLGDAYFESYFAPEDEVMAKILKEVESASKSIDIMAFSFTSKPLSELLIAKAQKGVTVRCLLDASQAGNNASQDVELASAEVSLRLSENRSGRMHHKVIIIDNRVVISGSFNFSKNADTRNDENVIFMRYKPVAELFTEEFNRCWRGIKGY